MQLVPSRKTHSPGLSRWHNDMDTMFRRFLEDWETPLWYDGNWTPALDVADREDSLLVRVELPGLKSEDIDISVQGNVLIITGEKKESTEEKEKNYYHSERRFGSFRREVTLPTGVDANKIDATFHDGVLSIVLPKSEAEKPKHIRVKAQAA
jgi:HSP20 family protein